MLFVLSLTCIKADIDKVVSKEKKNKLSVFIENFHISFNCYKYIFLVNVSFRCKSCFDKKRKNVM